MICILLVLHIFLATQNHRALFTYIAVHIEVEMDAGAVFYDCLLILIYAKHVFADIGDPYAAKDLGWFVYNSCSLNLKTANSVP